MYAVSWEEISEEGLLLALQKKRDYGLHLLGIVVTGQLIQVKVM